MDTPGAENFTSFQTSNHWHNNNDSPAFPYTNLTNRTRYLLPILIDSATTVVTASSVGGDFPLPFGGNFVPNGVSLQSIGATVDTADTTNSVTVDILLNGTSIFNQVVTTTKITIGANSKTSRGNILQPLIQTSSFLLGDILTFNVTANAATPPLGLKIFMKLVEFTT